jgi:hypothetical protein
MRTAARTSIDVYMAGSSCSRSCMLLSGPKFDECVAAECREERLIFKVVFSDESLDDETEIPFYVDGVVGYRVYGHTESRSQRFSRTIVVSYMGQTPSEIRYV